MQKYLVVLLLIFITSVLGATYTPGGSFGSNAGTPWFFGRYDTAGQWQAYDTSSTSGTLTTWTSAATGMVPQVNYDTGNGFSYLHPGPTIGERSCFRFVAPESGTVSYTTTVSVWGVNSAGTQTNSDVSVTANGVPLYATEVYYNGFIHSVPKSVCASLAQGQYIDVCVGFGTDLAYFFDSTAVDLSIASSASACPTSCATDGPTSSPYDSIAYQDDGTPYWTAGSLDGSTFTAFDNAEIVSSTTLRVSDDSAGTYPRVTYNYGTAAQTSSGTTWQPKMLALHPGSATRAAFRFKVPASTGGYSAYKFTYAFWGISSGGTGTIADVAISVNGAAPVYTEDITYTDGTPSAAETRCITLSSGAVVDFSVGTTAYSTNDHVAVMLSATPTCSCSALPAQTNAAVTLTGTVVQDKVADVSGDRVLSSKIAFSATCGSGYSKIVGMVGPADVTSQFTVDNSEVTADTACAANAANCKMSLASVFTPSAGVCDITGTVVYSVLSCCDFNCYAPQYLTQVEVELSSHQVCSESNFALMTEISSLGLYSDPSFATPKTTFMLNDVVFLPFKISYHGMGIAALTFNEVTVKIAGTSTVLYSSGSNTAAGAAVLLKRTSLSNIVDYANSKAWISFQIMRDGASPFASVATGTESVTVNVVFDITYKSSKRAVVHANEQANTGVSFVITL